MRTLVITDSTGMPQPKIGLKQKDTYIGKLDGYVEVLSGGGYPIKEFSGRVNNIASYIEDKAFDLGIIGLGLADCAPRPIPTEVRGIIERLPLPLRYMATKTLHVTRPQLVKLKLNQYTPIDEFTYYYNQILNITVRVCNAIIVIQIAPIRDSIEKHSPGFRNQIAIYNRHILAMCMYHSKVRLINLEDMKDEKYLTNDAHMTKEGHEYIWGRMDIQRYYGDTK